MDWELEVVFERRSKNGKLNIELDCIIIYLYTLVKQSKVGAKCLKC